MKLVSLAFTLALTSAPLAYASADGSGKCWNYWDVAQATIQLDTMSQHFQEQLNAMPAFQPLSPSAVTLNENADSFYAVVEAGPTCSKIRQEFKKIDASYARLYWDYTVARRTNYNKDVDAAFMRTHLAYNRLKLNVKFSY